MDQKPVFKNVHNKMYHTPDGVKWDSRACAVVAHVWFVKNGVPYVLVGKRGKFTDHAEKLNIPCGYLDRNENLQEAMFREVWEETGLDLEKYTAKAIYMQVDQPWLVYSNPDENLQNVAMHMGLVVDIGRDELPELSLDNMEVNESLGAYWKSFSELDAIPAEDWAFNHLVRLRAFRAKISHLRIFG